MPCNMEGPPMPHQKTIERKALIVGIVITLVRIFVLDRREGHTS